MDWRQHREMKDFIDTLATALLSLPMPTGEYAVEIRVEKRIGTNRDVAIDVTGLAARITSLRRKSHVPTDGLELEAMPFMQKAIRSTG